MVFVCLVYSIGDMLLFCCDEVWIYHLELLEFWLLSCMFPVLCLLIHIRVKNLLPDQFSVIGILHH